MIKRALITTAASLVALNALALNTVIHNHTDKPIRIVQAYAPGDFLEIAKELLAPSGVTEKVLLRQASRLNLLECDEIVLKTNTRLFVGKDKAIEYTTSDNKKLSPTGTDDKPLCTLLATYFKNQF